MPQIHIQNEKKLFGDLRWFPLISDAALEWLKAELPALAASSPGLHKDAAALVAACESLPTCMAYLRLGARDLAPGEGPAQHASAHSPYGYAQRPARGWLRAQGFVGKSSNNPPNAPGLTPEALGWVAADRLAKKADALKRLADALGFAPPELYGAKGLLKKTAQWTIIEHRAEERLASGDAFAIYLPNAPGYMNDHGAPAALAGARLFESAAAASRTIVSRRLARVNAVVVIVEARVKGLDPVVAPACDLGPLNAALAHEEARQIQEALQSASVESLRQRLAELEAQLPQEQAEERPSAPTRRRL